MSYTASAVTGQVPLGSSSEPLSPLFPSISERITDKSLRFKFQKLLEWPEPKLSRVRLSAVC